MDLEFRDLEFELGGYDYSLILFVQVAVIDRGSSASVRSFFIFILVRGRSLQLPPWHNVEWGELQTPTGYKWLASKV